MSFGGYLMVLIVAGTYVYLRSLGPRVRVWGVACASIRAGLRALQGIGLTNIEKLAGDNEVQYKTTSTTSSTFKTTVRVHPGS